MSVFQKILLTFKTIVFLWPVMLPPPPCHHRLYYIRSNLKVHLQTRKFLIVRPTVYSEYVTICSDYEGTIGLLREVFDLSFSSIVIVIINITHYYDYFFSLFDPLCVFNRVLV